jgi:hypothetical protein
VSKGDKLSEKEIGALITGAAMAGTIPLVALLKTLIEQKVVDKNCLKKHLELDVKLDQLPPIMKPCWNRL